MSKAQLAAAGVAALMLAACGVLLGTQDVMQQRTVLTSFQPRALRWPGWLDSFPEAAPATMKSAIPPRPELVGAPDDWRDNINYGFHPDEARVPEDEAQDAMQTLINAAGGGEAVTASEAMKVVKRQKLMSKRITQARIEASNGASPEQLAKILSPCEENPNDLRCSEYPRGQYTPEYDKARYGPSIKVPNGAIRNVEGSAEDTDGRRLSAPESEYDYEVRSLTANYEDQESPQRRAKDGYHDRIDAEDPMAHLQNEKLKPPNTYMKARYGPGIKMINRQKAADGRVAATFEEASGRERAAPEYWKAKYGAYGVYPFRNGGSDDRMAFGVKTQAPHLGQEYFKAKYGPTGYAMFNLNEAADTEDGKQVRLPKRQWHAEGIVRPTEYEQ